MNDDLKKIAEQAFNEATNTTPAGQIPDEDETIFCGTPTPTPAPAAPIIDGVEESQIPDVPLDTDLLPPDVVDAVTGTSVITDDDLRAALPELDEIAYGQSSSELRDELEGYRKNLIMNGGLTPEEATIAAKNRLKNRANEIQTAYLEKNPTLGIVEIDKKDLESVAFSPEERDKLEVVKKIKLVVVEDEELKNIRLEEVSDSEFKTSFIRTIDDAISTYTVPLPLFGDLCTFKGVQIYQLYSLINHPGDEAFSETLTRQANLLYDRFSGGALLRKFDENNNVILSFNDFVNSYPVIDITMGLYGIVTASSIRNLPLPMTCPGDTCAHEWDTEYSVKSIFSAELFSEDFKNRYADILKIGHDEDAAKRLHDNMYKIRRYKSPFTNNIYDLSPASIGKALRYSKTIETMDLTPTEAYGAMSGLNIARVYVYNPKSGAHILVEDSNIDRLIDTVRRLPDEDITLIADEVAQWYAYSPLFVVETKCPKCGDKIRQALDIETMIFHRALDSRILTR